MGNVLGHGSAWTKGGNGMLTLIISICAIAVFFRLGILAFKLAWGITKIVLSLVFAPVLFILLMVGGLAYVALGLVVIMALVTLIASFAAV